MLSIATMNAKGLPKDKYESLCKIIVKYRLAALVVTETKGKPEEILYCGGKEFYLLGEVNRSSKGVAVAHNRELALEVPQLTDRIVPVMLKPDIGIIGVYGLTDEKDHRAKHLLWDELRVMHTRLQKKTNCIFILGDFNAGHENVRAPGMRSYVRLKHYALANQLRVLQSPRTSRSGKTFPYSLPRPEYRMPQC